MKLTIVQQDIQNRNYLEVLEDLRDSGTDLVLFGELAVTGCLYEGLQDRKLLTVEELSEQFKLFPFEVMIGTPRIENNQIFNSYIHFTDSSISTYDKINLFEPMNETVHFTKGEKRTLFESHHNKLGASICYDVRFPELYDELKSDGADILLVPAAFPRVRIDAWKSLLIERAKQTGLPVIGINSIGNDGTNEFGGSSMVIDANGSIIAQADEINETIIEVEL